MSEITDTQKAVKISIGAVSLALNVFTVLFAIYNFWKYLYGKRVAKVLIVLFYLFVFICTICQCYISVKYIMLVKASKYVAYPLEISVQGLYYIVGLSMFQLAISIQRSLRIIRKKTMVRRQRCTVAILVLLMIPSFGLVFFNKEIIDILTGLFVLIINAAGFFYLRC